jgi:hypothetical protein
VYCITCIIKREAAAAAAAVAAAAAAAAAVDTQGQPHEVKEHTAANLMRQAAEVRRSTCCIHIPMLFWITHGRLLPLHLHSASALLISRACEYSV